MFDGCATFADFGCCDFGVFFAGGAGLGGRGGGGRGVEHVFGKVETEALEPFGNFVHAHVGLNNLGCVSGWGECVGEVSWRAGRMEVLSGKLGEGSGCGGRGA